METLIEANNSYVGIYRNWIDPEYASKLLDEIKTSLPWEQHTVMMMGKEILQPRQLYACGDDNIQHNYSGLTLHLNPWFSPRIIEIKDTLAKSFECPINSCLFNEYKDGSQYIGYHSDKEMNPNYSSVFGLSLGDTRDFYFKSKKATKEVIKTKVNHGDLMIMLGDTQKHYTHSVPKRAKGGYRVSITFRVL